MGRIGVWEGRECGDIGRKGNGKEGIMVHYGNMGRKSNGNMGTKEKWIGREMGKKGNVGEEKGK